MALIVAQALYLFLPLLVSAVLAGVVQRYDWLAGLRRPIDGGKRWRGKRWFGDSKTWRGVVIAIVGCVATVVLQRDVIGARATRGLWAAVFYLWDQVDMLTVAWPFLALWVAPAPRLVLASFGVALTLHPLMSLAGYLIGARKSAR